MTGLEDHGGLWRAGDEEVVPKSKNGARFLLCARAQLKEGEGVVWSSVAKGGHRGTKGLYIGIAAENGEEAPGMGVDGAWRC